MRESRLRPVARRQPGGERRFTIEPIDFKRRRERVSNVGGNGRNGRAEGAALIGTLLPTTVDTLSGKADSSSLRPAE
jgi:hypothetical protein